MNDLTQLLPFNLVLILLLMLGLWARSLVKRDASIVDPFWGTGFVVVAWVCVLLTLPVTSRSLILAVLTTLWGLRLSLYLFWRNRQHAEDPRYAAMRNKHGSQFWWVSLFTVFLLQGLIMWFVSFPIQVGVVDTQSVPLGWLDFLGVAVWAVGIFFEAVGDWQLSRFKSNPENQGRVLKTGLWRYTRHPNYFGDFCVWWGLYLISIQAHGWWTIGSPLLMSFFLMKVSGVTLLEKDITDRRPEYAEYQRSTNAFFPGPPRNP